MLQLPLPTPEIIERATAFREAGASPVAAKPSATVIVLRDAVQAVDALDSVDAAAAVDAVEVFMIRRLVAMSFAGGMHVFPGGVVDPADRIGRDADAALATAAIRETFEESGLLFATGTAHDVAALEADRLALIRHCATLDDVLSRHRLQPRLDLLRPWSRWITPDFEPRRYDTGFFVATAPPGQDARDVGGESDAAEWVTPAYALAAAARGEWLLMPPTEATLHELVGYRSAADVFEAALRRDVCPVHADIDLGVDPPVFVLRTTA
jgi:8-oxo-dGTP pyrophosphatase MutT (NUDIX family)